MQTIAYIDGFNLYRRLLKGHDQAKWLNLEALLQRMLEPHNEIIPINYYTAGLSGKYDPALPIRQHQYLRALETLPTLTVHKGSFETSERYKRLARPAVFDDYCPLYDVPERVLVVEQKEKGSDVKLAVHLVRDAFQKKFDVAVVVTNDSDIAEPIRIVTQEIGLPVGILVPDRAPSRSLKQVADFVRHIDLADAMACQFPDRLSDTLHKPAKWYP